MKCCRSIGIVQQHFISVISDSNPVQQYIAMCSRIREVFGVEVLPVFLVTILFIGLILS